MMKTLAEFKNEYRLKCSDTWGDAMEAWFECAGQMNKRGLDIPTEWEYRPGMGSNGTDIESYWYELFEATNDKLLIQIGNLMFKYCAFLKLQGVDY